MADFPRRPFNPNNRWAPYNHAPLNQDENRENMRPRRRRRHQLVPQQPAPQFVPVQAGANRPALRPIMLGNVPIQPRVAHEPPLEENPVLLAALEELDDLAAGVENVLPNPPGVQNNPNIVPNPPPDPIADHLEHRERDPVDGPEEDDALWLDIFDVLRFN